MSTNGTLAKLQDQLPKDGASVRAWLNEHTEEVKALMEEKSPQVLADLLGLDSKYLYRWRNEHGLTNGPIPKKRPKRAPLPTHERLEFWTLHINALKDQQAKIAKEIANAERYQQAWALVLEDLNSRVV